ncbi:MAG: ethanolamine ammonia lyase large subunit, partial [Betaproteobacteria bacterium]|nr:ethanolamine ammonia lyase large subunit [Betaproteobacteria bacterium]
YVRRVLNLKPAPEFETWLHKMAIFRDGAQVQLNEELPPRFRNALLKIST